jgi:hypothetical protein
MTQFDQRLTEVLDVNPLASAKRLTAVTQKSNPQGFIHLRIRHGQYFRERNELARYQGLFCLHDFWTRAGATTPLVGC